MSNKGGWGVASALRGGTSMSCPDQIPIRVARHTPKTITFVPFVNYIQPSPWGTCVGGAWALLEEELPSPRGLEYRGHRTAPQTERAREPPRGCLSAGGGRHAPDRGALEGLVPRGWVGWGFVHLIPMLVGGNHFPFPCWGGGWF